MRIVTRLSLATALAGMALAAPAMAKDKEPKAAPAKYTPAVQSALVDAQKALAANDLPTAQAKLAAAKAAAVTPDDKYVTGSLEYQLYQKNKDEALLVDGIDMMLDSGKAPADLQAQLYLNQGKIAYQAKNYAKAETGLLAAQKAGSTDADLIPVLVSAQSFNGRTLQALQTLNAAVEANVAANKPVPAEWFQRGVTIGFTAKGTPADLAPIREQTGMLTKRWLAAYPTKSNWHDAIAIYRDQTKPPTDVIVDAFRLMRAVGALNADVDYREYADDIYRRFPGETVEVLKEGGAKGFLNLSGKNDAAEVLQITQPKVAADKASLTGAEKAARAAATGTNALTTADAYVGYGMYPQAIDLYKVALQKGGADAGTVNLHMGWAMALSGDAAGAKTAFAAVTGVRKTLADYWMIHLDHPTQG